MYNINEKQKRCFSFVQLLAIHMDYYAREGRNLEKLFLRRQTAIPVRCSPSVNQAATCRRGEDGTARKK